MAREYLPRKMARLTKVKTFFKTYLNIAGLFKNDVFSGFGTYRYGDGERYEGLYVNGVRQGLGKYFYVNGNR
jgi:hypothetical protein